VLGAAQPCWVLVTGAGCQCSTAMLRAGYWSSTAMLGAGIAQSHRTGPSTSKAQGGGAAPSRGAWWVLALGLLSVLRRESPAQPGTWRYQWGWKKPQAPPTALSPRPGPSQGPEVTPSTQLLPAARAHGCTPGSAGKGALSPGTSGQVTEVQAGRAAQPGITVGRKRRSVSPANVLIPFNSPAAPQPRARPLCLGSSSPAMHTGLFPASLLGVISEEGERRSPGSPEMLQKNILKPPCHLLCFQRN